MSSANKRKVSEVWINSRSGHNEARMQVKIVDQKNRGNSPFTKSSGYLYTNAETPEFKRDSNLFRWYHSTSSFTSRSVCDRFVFIVYLIKYSDDRKKLHIADL